MAAADAPGSLTTFSMAATPSTNAPSNIQGGPGIPPLTTGESENPTSPTDQWSDTYAAKIVMGDFQKMEAYRTINHDWRFRTSDQLYLAWKQRQTWEGTKIPRSSMGIFIALEQIESLLPSVILSLFPDNNRLPFEAEPTPGTSIEQAEAVSDLLGWQLQDIGEPGKYLSMRELCRRAYKQAYIYGNGIIEFGVIDKNVIRTKFERQQVPVRQMIPHPVTGEPFAAPTGQMKSIVHQFTQSEHLVRPSLMNTDIRDFYWDPNCSSHNVNDGVMCATRHLMTVDQVMEYQGIDGFNLPSARDLEKFAQIKTTSQGDTTKMNQESFRGMTWQPSIDYTVDPSQKRLEVIRYWQKNHHVWLIGRQWTAYNKGNQYGLLPFLDAFYVDVPGRFAGLSICDLVECDQKLAEAIINARVDELNLMIHRPLIVKAGRPFSASQQRIRPGVVWKVEDPANDIKWMETKPTTQDAYIEVNALEQRVQKKTGVTDLAVLGTPSAGGNSANRTATGVSAQSGASGKRIQYHVENAEDQFIVPALDILHKLNQIFLPTDEMMQVLGPEGQVIQIDPVDILNADVKFKMNASSKMRTRNAMAAGGLGLVLQTYLNPEVMQIAMMAGKKIDFAQVERLVNDTFGMAPTALWADMNPQEQQQFVQMKMMPEMMKRQTQQARLDSHSQIQDAKDETAIIKTVLEKLVTPQAAHAILNALTNSSLPTGENDDAATAASANSGGASASSGAA